MHMRSILHLVRAPGLLTAALALALASGIAEAREVRGIQFEEQKQVQGKTLRLNGAGDRAMFGFPAYAAGLYVENPSQNAEELVSSEQVKRLELHMLRDLSKQQFANAIEKGIRANTPPDQMANLEPRLNQLVSALPDMKQGQVVTMTHQPGQGIVVEGQGIQPITIQGDDFAQAALRIWLGPEPAQESLKRDLLAGAGSAGGQTSQR